MTEYNGNLMGTHRAAAFFKVSFIQRDDPAVTLQINDRVDMFYTFFGRNSS
jgi:hypothetical protein